MRLDPQSSHPQQLFEQHLDEIRRLAFQMAQRSGFSYEDSEDFVSALLIKLIENQYRVIAEYNGQGKFQAYISVVAGRYLSDYRDKVWGKYRPSREAQRLGEDGVALERLTVRDGYSRDVAIMLLAQGGSDAPKEKHLFNLYGLLPNRYRRTFVATDILDYQPDRSLSPEDFLESKDDQDRLRGAWQVVAEAMAEFEPKDRLLIRWVYVDRLKISQIAKQENVLPRKLYSRLERLLAKLRKALQQKGLL